MAAAADIVAGIMASIAGLGVPWWGWSALFVMIFFGLLVPDAQGGEPDPAEAFPGRR